MKHKSALQVQDGIEQPSQVNPYFDFSQVKRKAVLSEREYVEGILSGNKMILSKAITLIESNLHEHQVLAQSILEACIPHSGNAIRIGITGVPGAGKSTFIEAFGKHLTERGHRLAVLAIDPSSERSKGSILGDKTRMEELSVDENAFIRPSPSACSLGGVARKTAETLILCEAAGYDVVFIETVGVGQSETAVHNMVDFFLLLMISGAGDELQGIKRGIMEMADAIVINKADGDNVKKAEITRVQLANVLRLFPAVQSDWKPPVVLASALYKSGMDDIWQIINEYKQKAIQSGFFEQNRIQQLKGRFNAFMQETLLDSFYENPQVKQAVERLQQQITDKKINPYTAGKMVLEGYLNE
jgi:LAO/AO transport system kinase